MAKILLISEANICIIALILLYSIKFILINKVETGNCQLYGIEDLFKTNEMYYFYPNPGNLGDMLINLAEYEFFKKVGIKISTRLPKKFNTSFNLIIGGGWAYVDKYQCGERSIFKYLKDPHLKNCIFLPQSINNCNNLLQLLNNNFTVLIREPISYEYCIFNNNRARFIRSNDMAFSTNVSNIPFEILNLDFNINDKMDCNNPYINTGEKCKYYSENYYNVSYLKYLKFSNFYIKTFQSNSYIINNKTVRFYFRCDSEKKLSPKIYQNLTFLDASVSNPPPYIHKDKQYTYFWARMLLLMINNSDIVVTDRLHIAISAYLLKKEIYIYDNSYGKLSGVFEQNFACFPSIHYVNNDLLPFNVEYLHHDQRSINTYQIHKFLNLSYEKFKREMKRFI